VRGIQAIPESLRWHEGMLLAPQHFQELSTRLESLIHQYAALTAPFSWGVRRLEVDESLLDHRIFRIQALDAVMPDGLHVAQVPEQLDLAPYKADAERSPIRIYLCVPEASLGERHGPMARFLTTAGTPVADRDPEADEGQVAVTLPRLRPNATLRATDEGTGGLIKMPIAEIEYIDSSFQLTDYVPPHPMLSAEKWCQPLVALANTAATKVRGKANYLLEMIRSPSGGSNRDRFERQLHSLMAGLPALEAHLAIGQVHPYNLFVAMTTLAAHVAAVGALDEVPRFPRYDHENIAEIFAGVGRSLFNTLDLGVQESFTEYRFDGEGHNFSIAFREEWKGHKLVLGFMGQPTQEIIAWAENCYIGSETHIEAMSKNRDLGCGRNRDDNIEGLRRRPGTVLYTVAEDLRRVESNETLYIFNPLYGPNDVGPTRVVLYVQHEQE
jgi:type VI secretion system protein ImpJ